MNFEDTEQLIAFCKELRLELEQLSSKHEDAKIALRQLDPILCEIIGGRLVVFAEIPSGYLFYGDHSTLGEQPTRAGGTMSELYAKFAFRAKGRRVKDYASMFETTPSRNPDEA